MEDYRQKDPRGGCWTCTHWYGETCAEGYHTVCHGPHSPAVIADPDMGCAFWMREIGADDEIVFRAERFGLK